MVPSLTNNKKCICVVSRKTPGSWHQSSLAELSKESTTPKKEHRVFSWAVICIALAGKRTKGSPITVWLVSIWTKKLGKQISIYWILKHLFWRPNRDVMPIWEVIEISFSFSMGELLYPKMKRWILFGFLISKRLIGIGFQIWFCLI